MVTLMSQQSRWEQRRQAGTVASASATSSWFPAGAALGVAGLATASTAITCLAISQSSSSSATPASAALQQGNDNGGSSCGYLLALSGLFYTGIAELGAAVWVMVGEPRGRAAAGRRLVYASLAPLTAAAGLLAAATLFR